MVSSQPLDQGPNGRVLPPGNFVSGAFLPPSLQASALSTFHSRIDPKPVRSSLYRQNWLFLHTPHFQVKGAASFSPIVATHLPSLPEASILFSQGDKEAELGLPFSPLCDRTSTLVAQSQIGEYEEERKGDVWVWPGLFQTSKCLNCSCC